MDHRCYFDFLELGARHIYALDIDDREFSSLKKIFEETYTTTKVSFCAAILMLV